jgi:hypothetical protein
MPENHDSPPESEVILRAQKQNVNNSSSITKKSPFSRKNGLEVRARRFNQLPLDETNDRSKLFPLEVNIPRSELEPGIRSGRAPLPTILWSITRIEL